MFAAWSRIPRGKRRVWGMVAGVISAGTVLKVVYFKFSRKIMVDDSARKHQEGLEHLREARDFAEWSRKDREARLPRLTAEQEAQMMQYLRIVEQHGLSKSFMAAAGGKEECEGCPVFGLAKTVKRAMRQGKDSSSER